MSHKEIKGIKCYRCYKYTKPVDKINSCCGRDAGEVGCNNFTSYYVMCTNCDNTKLSLDDDDYDDEKLLFDTDDMDNEDCSYQNVFKSTGEMILHYPGVKYKHLNNRLNSYRKHYPRKE
jgi:hypothetical protein